MYAIRSYYVSSQLQQDIPILNGLIQRVRASRFDEQRIRVVLDLSRVLEYKFRNNFV